MNNIKLSIIVPVYNLENYIEDCILSILPQLNEEVELILIDDGSTDNSAEIIKKYSHNYANIFYFFQQNQKQGAAGNNGLIKANGEYVWFVDGDDMVTDNAIKQILSYEKSHLENHDMMMFELC